MKDLITTIGSIMILMVFVMQFCSNQVLATKILFIDSVIDNFEQSSIEESVDIEKYKKMIGDCVGCGSNEVIIERNEEKMSFRIPLKNVIACGEFLGISEAENQSTYTREILAG